MGLYVHSLGELLRLTETRSYYIYVLDYGWDQPIADAVKRNLNRMADEASRSDAVVLSGPPVHFADEVLSWHQVNGAPADAILPALLITTRHPRTFREHGSEHAAATRESMLLIPLGEICQTAQDVTDLITKVFADVREKKALKDFRVVKKMRKGRGRALVDALILEPNVGGLGINLKTLPRVFSKEPRSRGKR
jgi:hypothetical protein